MRTLWRFLAVLLVTCPLIGPTPVLAAEGKKVTAVKVTGVKVTEVLPRRPQALTRAQYEALQNIARQPEHAAIANLRATYRDKATEFATDGGQVAFLTALGGGILTVLIAAAPL